MLPSFLRQALRSPLPDITQGLRFWLRHGARVRRARLLRDCADGVRLRQLRQWQARSARLYRRSVATLGELAGPVEPSAPDPAVAAHTALARATSSYRRGAVGLARLCGAVGLVGVVVLAAALAISPALRLRMFPPDLAAGRPWKASSHDLGLPESGNGPATSGDVFFHTRSEYNPFVEIDLGGEHVVRSLLVENRTECCLERALPLNVEVWDGNAWQLIAQRRAFFKTWKYDVTPVRTTKLRFRRPGNGYFHLKRISVYGQ
jgi:hypothetical protein